MSETPPQPQAIHRVLCIEDANRWAEHNLFIALRKLREQDPSANIDDIAHAASLVTTSSAFSGTGGPENTMHALRKALEHFSGKVRHAPENVFAIEHNIECQRELLMLPERPRCIYSDIVSCLNLSVAAALRENAARMNFEDLERVFQSPQIIKPDMPCVVHGKRCFCRKADLHVAGTPCVSWSLLGKRDGASGDTALAWFTWVAQRRAIQEKWILHENVEGFPVRLLCKALGDLYVVGNETSALLCTTDLGQPYDRVRRCTWCIHKRTIVVDPSRHHLWPSFAQECRRACEIHWSSYFRASTQELQRERVWAAQRPSVLAADTEDGDCSDFESLLSRREKAWLQRYRQLCPHGVVMLGQDPDVFRRHNGSSSNLQCIVKKCGLMWSMRHSRWLTGYELLSVHNYPMYHGMMNFGAETSFNRERSTWHLPERRRNAVMEQAGNGMSLAMISVPIAWLYLDLAVRKNDNELGMDVSTSALVAESRLRRCIKRVRSLSGDESESAGRHKGACDCVDQPV